MIAESRVEEVSLLRGYRVGVQNSGPCPTQADFSGLLGVVLGAVEIVLQLARAVRQLPGHEGCGQSAEPLQLFIGHHSIVLHRDSAARSRFLYRKHKMLCCVLSRFRVVCGDAASGAGSVSAA